MSEGTEEPEHKICVNKYKPYDEEMEMKNPIVGL
jgi:hypothetical protein